jgi:hypothetical protein
MTTPNGTTGDQVEGVVEARTASGIKVNGTWASESKFHPVGLPDRGTRVRLELDNKGFIRTLHVLDAAPSASSSDRDRTITRLSVLKTAANFLGAMAQVHEEVRSDHVLTLADKWLAWVEQKGEGESD